ncbi:DUF7344 domain-containing protein [Haloarcula sediminis]|uniref:DUF7344 domain-containing protein n=1 Tax=Haloarcula sediminis TaxID=3111777 RepID=UPI002D78C822|nr:hypothetical protein [Haloarcula sp. CK38]
MKTLQRSRPDRHRLSATLADRRARELLSHLSGGPATVRDLAVALAAAERGCARSAVTTADRRQYRRQFEHRHLPRLADAGLVTCTPGGLVRYVPTTLDRFEVQFPPLDEPDHPTWAAAAAVLGRSHRYPLVSIVDETESLSLSRLADRLVGTDATDATPSDLAIALHHADLPKLAAVDLLAYEPEGGTVRRTSETATVL